MRPTGVRRAGAVAVWLLPFAFLAAFVAYPLWQQIYGSFSGWYQLKPHGWAGIQNYVGLFGDIVARVAALHTAFYILLAVPLEVGLGLAAAWMTLRVRRGQGLLALVFLLPIAVPWTVAGNLFYGIFNLHGVADQVAQDVTGSGYSLLWLFHPRLAFGVIVAIAVWKGAPWCYLLLLGALSALPEDVLEAARVDGARGLYFWWKVIIPMIRPMFVFVVVLRVLAEAQAYYGVALLTNGGPSFPGATELVGFYGDVVAFGYYNFGRASAMGTLVGAVLFVFAILGWRLAYSRGRARLPQKLAASLANRRSARALHEQRAPHARRHGAHTPPPITRRPKLARGLASMRRTQRLRWGLLAVMGVFVFLPFAGEEASWLGRNEFSHTFWPPLERGLLNSLLMSAITVAGTLLLAVPAAYLLAFKTFKLRQALFGFVLFALAVPGIIFIYPQFEEIVWLGLVNSRVGMLVLYVTANLPLAIFFLRPAFASVPRALIDSMRIDGASSLTVLWRLVLRYSASTISALALLTVVWVWGEVPIAQAVLSPTNQSAETLPLILAGGLTGADFIGNPNMAYLISLLAPLTVFFAAQRYFRRGLVSSALLQAG